VSFHSPTKFVTKDLVRVSAVRSLLLAAITAGNCCHGNAERRTQQKNGGSLGADMK
jgi:hypothetical protein